MKPLLSVIFAVCIFVPSLASHAAPPEYHIVIKQHRFVPATITVPAREKVKLVVDNQDPTPEEFESHSLRREKVINGKSKAMIYIGPLNPGTYEFVGEYHENTARGTIVVK